MRDSLSYHKILGELNGSNRLMHQKIKDSINIYQKEFSNDYFFVIYHNNLFKKNSTITLAFYNY